jgi:hypothetical protein
MKDREMQPYDRTTAHQKALEAADEAYAKVQASAGIEWLTSEQQHMRGLDAAISAYLSEKYRQLFLSEASKAGA